MCSNTNSTRLIPSPHPGVFPCVGVFQATSDKLDTVVKDVIMVEFRYPMGALELNGNRAAVLCMVSGWLLASGFTHAPEY